MPLTPNAPDYVSQVRGVINDLRQNYLQKQQLFLEEEKTKANLALQYAQLAAQRDNARKQAELEEARIEAGKINSLRELQRDQYTISRQLASDELARDRLAFDQQKELADLQLKRNQEERDVLANNLENKFRIAYEKNDPEEISRVMEEIGNSNIQTAQRTALYNNVQMGIQKKRELEQYERNLKTAQDADMLTQEVLNLDPSQYTPDQFSKVLMDYSSKFSGLGNNDKVVVDSFSTAKTLAAEKAIKFRDSEIGSATESFRKMAASRVRLEPEYQKKYDELNSKPGGITSEELQGLAFQRNKQQSIERLRSYNDRFARNLENMVQQNPGLAIIKTDPMTGERYRSFTYEPPDLTPVEGYNGTIDPDTGLITKQTLDQIKKFEDEIISPTYQTGQVPFIRSFQQQQAAVPPAPPTKETAALPFRATPGRFEPVTTGQTVVLPTAPSALVVSPETISGAVEAYNTDPDGFYKGRPVREVIARLQSRGIPLPGLRGQAVAEGQEQRR